MIHSSTKNVAWIAMGVSLLTSPLTLVKSQDFLMLGKNEDPESLYKPYVLPLSHYAVIGKGKFDEHVPKDKKFAFIMGHGHCDDISGYGYDEIFKLIKKYDQVAITGCGQSFWQAELALWRMWKCEKPERCPDNAGKGKYYDCLELDAKTAEWNIKTTTDKCKKISDGIANAKLASSNGKGPMTELEQWNEARRVTIPMILDFRSKIVFMTDRVLNLIYDPVHKVHNVWLTPNNDQAQALKGKQAIELGWQLDYSICKDLTPTPIEEQVKAFRSKQALIFSAQLMSIVEKNKGDKDFIAHTRMVQITPIDKGVENMLQCSFNMAFKAKLHQEKIGKTVLLTTHQALQATNHRHQDRKRRLERRASNQLMEHL